MDFAQRLVALCYESLGYFVVEGLCVGVREADLLAINVDEKDRVCDRIHIEVQVSAKPAGVLRNKSQFGSSYKFPIESAAEFIKKKYKNEKLIKAISERLKSKKYRLVFIHGRLKDKSQLNAFSNENIECVPIGKLVSEALKANPVRELIRTVQVAELLKILKP